MPGSSHPRAHPRSLSTPSCRVPSCNLQLALTSLIVCADYNVQQFQVGFSRYLNPESSRNLSARSRDPGTFAPLSSPYRLGDSLHAAPHLPIQAYLEPLVAEELFLPRLHYTRHGLSTHCFFWASCSRAQVLELLSVNISGLSHFVSHCSVLW